MKPPFITLCIIFSLLIANFAVAADMHVEESMDAHQAHLLLEATQQKLSDAAEADCGDHSCHISVHFLGYFNESVILSSVDTSIALTAYEEKIRFLNLDPPVKPPQA